MTGSSSVKLWELRWPEVQRLAPDDTLIIIPTGSIEQHGPQLPLDTDIHCSSQLALRTAAAAQQQQLGSVLVGPPMWWGTSPHHMAYPGTISLRMQTMSDLIVDICGSLLRHGFYRFLLLNGHGGNAGVLAATTMRMSDEMGLHVACVSYWQLIREALSAIGDTPLGGMGHADEMETSLQLHLRPDRVDTGAVSADMPSPLTSYSGIDFRNPGVVAMPLDFVRDSTLGVMGDPTSADAAKGALIADAAVTELLKLSSELLSLRREQLLPAAAESRPEMPGARRNGRAPM